MSSKLERFHHFRTFDSNLKKHKTQYQQVLSSLSHSSRLLKVHSLLSSKTQPIRIRTRRNTVAKLSTRNALAVVDLKLAVSDHFGRIFIGDYESSLNFTLLQDHEVYGILLLGKGAEPYCWPFIKGGYKQLPLANLREDLVAAVYEIKRFFHTLLQEGNVLVAHTRDRAVSYATVMTYLMATCKHTYDQAFSIVKTADHKCKVTAETEDALRRLESRLLKGL